MPALCLGASAGLRAFDIPAQELHAALSEFARQADRQILFSTGTVADRRSNAVKGQVEPEAALRLLLRGTGITFRVTADQTILAELGAAPLDRTDGPQMQTLPRSQREQSRSSESFAPGSRTALDLLHADALLDEVVVTGTLIRGVQPAGAGTLGMSSYDVMASGASSASQLLTSFPQLTTFNSLDSLPENTQIAIKRPNIRNLPGLGASGGSTTLVLLDGHRLVGAGIQQTAPDPDLVPPSVIERVEVMPDGGSATYGSDAVGGVINFITRRRFDGVQASGRYGVADSYQAYDLNTTAGTSWSGGSGYLSLSYAAHDDLLGRERGYVRRYDAYGGPAADLECAPGTVAIGTGLNRQLYALPGLAANTANSCDTSDAEAFYPSEQFRSAFVGWSQHIVAGLDLDVRGFYSQRDVESIRGPFRSDAATITATNPFYRRTADNLAPQPPATQFVAFSWEPVFGDAAITQNTKLVTWGIAPVLTVDLRGSWQVRTLLNVGGSVTSARNPVLNEALFAQALAGTTTDTAVDPYDIAATPNKQLLSDIANYQFYGRGTQQLENYRAIADGTLFKLPGGDLQLAFGMEYRRETYRARSGDTIPGAEAALVLREAARDNRSAFAEVSAPIVGRDEKIPGISSLTLSASARYDDYSDFGGTTNPKYAITYEPLSWITLRGNWGKSFNAPSLADSAGALNTATVFSASTLPSPLPGQYSAAQASWPLIALQGGVSDIRPQTARTLSAGIDVRPPPWPGLTLGANYYLIHLSDLIGFPPVFSPQRFYANYGQFYVLAPTPEQVRDAVQDIPGGVNATVGIFDPGDPPIYALIDARRRNLGRAKLSGVDFSIRFERETSFGSVEASLWGTRELRRTEQPLAGLPWLDQLDADFSKLRLVGMLGTAVGPLRAQVRWKHSQGFRTQASVLQDRVGSFDVASVFASYDLERTGPLDGLQLTLNVDNLFNADPPRFRGAYNLFYSGYANGSTLGRSVQVGISKRF